MGMTHKAIFLALPLLLVTSGCGEVTPASSDPTPSEALQVNEVSRDLPDPEDVPAIVGEIDSACRAQLAGYIFGARFGFLLGVMTLLVSALLTGGVGPWLPYQMFTAGWIGLTSGWLPRLPDPRAEMTVSDAAGHSLKQHGLRSIGYEPRCAGEHGAIKTG